MNLVQSTVESGDSKWMDEKWKTEEIISEMISKFMKAKNINTLDLKYNLEWKVISRFIEEHTMYLIIYSYYLLIFIINIY